VVDGIEGMEWMFQSIAALCETSPGHTGEVPEPLAATTDVTRIIMIRYLDRTYSEQLAVPTSDTNEFGIPG